MTTAARKITEALALTWDNFDRYEQTAKNGLSQTDDDALATLCDTFDESYVDSYTDVMGWVRERTGDLCRQSSPALAECMADFDGMMSGLVPND